MSSIAYVTDSEMLEYHRLCRNRTIIFWRLANKKKFVTITYRRKEGDGYKRITLEIIPEDENSQNI